MTTSTNSTSPMTTSRWHPKYLERLASVYLEKYDTLGYIEAKSWYNNFLNHDLRNAVRPIIQQLVEKRGAKKKS